MRHRDNEWTHAHTTRGETYTDILSTAKGHLMMRQRTHTDSRETYTDNILSTAHCKGEKETCTHTRTKLVLGF